MRASGCVREAVMDPYVKTTFILRLIERFTLTAIVLIIAVAVLVAFWRTVHRIEFSVAKEKVGVAGATLIATPVLVLLALIGFTWVVLTNQIKLETEGPNNVGDHPQPNVLPGTQHTIVVGAAGTGENVASVLQALNCAARSPNLKQADREGIERLKAIELYSNWPDNLDLKEKETFRKWAFEKNNSDSVTPSGDVLQLLNARDPKCEN
jgi:hypothetical protein